MLMYFSFGHPVAIYSIVLNASVGIATGVI